MRRERTRPAARPHPRLPRAAGMSMVELLIAVFLLLVVTMGIIPLFARSATQNAIGAESTQVSNHVKSRSEQLLQADFSSADLTVPDGGVVLGVTEFWDPDSEAFLTTAPPVGSVPRYTRTTEVRQYSFFDLEDGVLQNPEPGGAPATSVHLKEIEVTVAGRDFGPLHSRRVVVRVIKSF